MLRTGWRLPFALAARWSLQGILLAVHWSGGAQLTDHRVAMPALAAMVAVAVLLRVGVAAGAAALVAGGGFAGAAGRVGVAGVMRTRAL